MMHRYFVIIVSAFLFVHGQTAKADEPLHSQMDRFVVAGHPDYAKFASPIASDSEFLRRVTLDLNGTIPTSEEAKQFLSDQSPDKRIKLIDRLLANPLYARRMALFFDVVFMERRRDAKVPRAGWEEFLFTAFAANKPYDQLVREVLSADGVDPKARAAAKFYLDRDLEPNLVTRDIGRVFLGRDLACAQCHDHPIIEDYKQDQYFGLYAFLNRSFLFPNANAATAVIAEKADGDVTFASVFDKSKTQKSTGPRLPDGKAVMEPKPEKGKEYKVAPAKDVRPVPAFSRREQLAKLIATAENSAFARTAVNRIWFLMNGRGLVHPLDLDHSDNPPSHPELLDLLAKEFVQHKFDLKWLIREIALSKTYQRSSEVSPNQADLPADRFLIAVLKPLSAEQLAYASLQASGQTDAEKLSLGKNANFAALDAKLAPRLAPFRSFFGGRPGEPDMGQLTTLDQTLFLKHGNALRGMITPRTGNLADRLAKLTEPKAIVDELFLSVLSRYPLAEERAEVTKLIASEPNRSAMIAEVIWALMTSAEFRFNH